MESVYGLIVAIFLILCGFSAGCIGDDKAAGVPAGGNIRQPGVLIETIGNVTGQGVILQGVPRGTIPIGTGNSDTTRDCIGHSSGRASSSIDGLEVTW